MLKLFIGLGFFVAVTTMTTSVQAQAKNDCELEAEAAELVMVSRHQGITDPQLILPDLSSLPIPDDAKDFMLTYLRELTEAASKWSKPQSEGEESKQVEDFKRSAQSECIYKSEGKSEDPIQNKRERDSLLRELCIASGVRAEQYMLERQRGRPIREVLELLEEQLKSYPDVISNAGKALSGVMRSLVLAAYREPIRATTSGQSAAAIEFGNAVTLKCLQETDR